MIYAERQQSLSSRKSAVSKLKYVLRALCLERSRKNPTQEIPIIVEDYAQRIKNRRERLGLKQGELAKKLAEKESVISALESGSMEPSVALAEKIGRILSIRLIESEDRKGPSIVMHEKSEGLTLGDMIKKK